MKTKLRSYLASGLSAVVFSVAFSTASAEDRDDRIEDAFQKSHVYRTQLKNLGVDADSDAGVVTLSGKVENDDQKRLAEDTVRAIPGVQRVNNQIRVTNEPKESSDEWIATKVRGSLLFHRNVGITQTDVTVRNGVVMLTGTAKSEAEKSLAGEYAADVKGVTRVDNKIEVVSSDAGVGRRVDSNVDALEADSEREARRVRAEARSDADRLRGDAREGTAEARAELKEDAAEAKRESRQAGRSVGDKIDDASITAQLKYALSVRRSTSAMHTDVTTENGVVTIRGDAKTAAEKDLVTQLAKGIEGVRDVRNQMTVAGQ